LEQKERINAEGAENAGFAEKRKKGEEFTQRTQRKSAEDTEKSNPRNTG
jgi:hypothetical protein